MFYCHKINNVKAYAVSLVGDDGAKARAAVILSPDTWTWNPQHILENDSVVWVPY